MLRPHFLIPIGTDVFYHRKRCEDLPDNLPVLAYVGGFSQLFAQLLRIFKFAQPVAPVFLHPEHSVPFSAKATDICFQKAVVKELQGLGIRAAGDKQTRVGNQSPAQHNSLQAGKFCLDMCNVLLGAEASVVAEHGL